MHWTDLELNRDLPDTNIREGFAQALGVPIEAVAIVDMTNSEEAPALISGEVQVAIDRWTQPGDFPLHLMVVVRGDDLTSRVRSTGTTIKYLLAFCRLTQCDVLISGDNASDETWLLLSHRGNTFNVVVNSRALDEGRFELLSTGATALTGTAHPS